jgi:hypothetical protein
LHPIVGGSMDFKVCNHPFSNSNMEQLKLPNQTTSNISTTNFCPNETWQGYICMWETCTKSKLCHLRNKKLNTKNM